MRHHLLSFLLFLLPLLLSAQEGLNDNKSPELLKAEQKVEKIINKMIKVDNIPLRNVMNDSLISAFTQLYKMRESLDYNFENFQAVAVLTTGSRSAAVVTWQLKDVYDNYIYYGLVAFKTKKDVNEVLVLKDSSQVKKGLEHSSMLYDSWYGAMYYDIREVRFKDDRYYVLLGLKRKSPLIKERIIETLNVTEPHFGKEVFEMGKKVMKKRLVYPHSSETDMTIAFVEDDLIVMDHLSPSKPVYEGKFQYYVPDLSFDALKLKKGIWSYEADHDARLDKNLKDRYYEMELPKQEKVY